MKLFPGEPAAGPRRVEPIATVLGRVRSSLPPGPPTGPADQTQRTRVRPGPAVGR
ncbi:MAG TPA: hypothetical protein VGP36_08570 [Mycobacteriales bacterium]|nr:hypothetical protein [Mycobacteriales bacterium]